MNGRIGTPPAADIVPVQDIPEVTASKYSRSGHVSPGVAGLPVLEDLPPVKGRRVLVRADLNVPLRPTNGDRFEVADDFRPAFVTPDARVVWLTTRGRGGSFAATSAAQRASSTLAMLWIRSARRWLWIAPGFPSWRTCGSIPARK